MKLLSPDILEPKLLTMDFVQPDIVTCGELSQSKVKPYIAGHITNGSSTFTFNVNGNQSITVPVNSNGKWKWVVDRTITSLANAFENVTNIDIIELNKLDALTRLASMCNGMSALEKVTFKKCDLSNVFTVDYSFRNCTKLTSITGVETLSPTTAQGTFASTKVSAIHASFFKNFKRLGDAFYNTPIVSVDISQADLDYIRNTFSSSQLKTLVLGNIKSGMEFSGTPFGNNLESVIMAEGKTIEGDFIISSTSKLTEQSVVNLFNAVAADDITLTFHATVYAMIQTQIDAEEGDIYDAYMNSDYDFDYASA